MTGGGTAILLVDLQNDFLHPDGAYARGRQGADEIAALPGRLHPLVDCARQAGLPLIGSLFTLQPGPDGEPLVSPHLKALRPFLQRGDFMPGSWGQRIIDTLQPVEITIEKIAYSAFYMSRLEWVLRRLSIGHLVVAGIVTNGGVASTVRDAHVRDFQVTVLQDGCAAFSPRIHDEALAGLKPVARLSCIQDTLEEIRAGRLASP
jgi:nicotinamidase-related amidase